jgi:hypothetical protein
MSTPTSLVEARAARGRPDARLILAGLAASAVALAVAPALLPETYSWVSMTTSESAAQGVPGAWLARLGFVLFGGSVVLLAALRGRSWGRAATILHACFGAFMVAAAVFSTRPWDGAPYNATEDALHSVAATAMGFAFALGVLATLGQAWRRGDRSRWWLDAVAVAASVLLPLGMTLWPEADGILQRIMFAVAYAWYAVQTARPHLVRG